MVPHRLALAACALLAAPAFAAIAPPAVGSAALLPPPGEAPDFVLAASGVQIYECRPLTGPSDFAWSLVASDATLSDGPRSVGRWVAPNQWESLSDRSSVSGVLRSMVPAGGGDLPWALLRAVPAGETGLFAGVTSIQRVNTAGGAPPAGGCDAIHAGEEARVPFTADLYFYKRATG